ncbi:MAG: hypothetical protein K2H35_03460 [Muribaculaceae bacterium]|nr:hypothetical protein [Muribaculaceae bacterium]
MTKKSIIRGIASFVIVLLCMPLGHALMIVMEHLMTPQAVNYSALAMGVAGVLIVVFGRKLNSDTGRTVAGLAGGLLFWTGAVEFGFVYYANRFGVEPLIENGEVVTKPEYLIMPSSIGFFVMVMLFYLTSVPTACPFLNFFSHKKEGTIKRNSAVSTFMELIMIMWASYLVLLLCYDSHFLGDRHPITFILAFGCLAGSIFMLKDLLECKTWGKALRQAIATVIIFWTFVEVMGRNNFLKEIWVEPFSHIAEMLWIAASFVIVTLAAILISHRKRVNLHH